MRIQDNTCDGRYSDVPVGKEWEVLEPVGHPDLVFGFQKEREATFFALGLLVGELGKLGDSRAPRGWDKV